MKPLKLLLAAALTLTPSAAFAATSGTVDASMTVTYSCDITFPATATLTPVGNTATASSTLALIQNGDTQYQLSALTLTGNNASAGTITIADSVATQIVSNSSTSGTAAANVLGPLNDSAATANFSLTTSDAAFTAGTYSIGATLSCVQYVP